MDTKKLSFGEQILGASALILLILSFLKLWAKFEINTGVEIPGVDTEQRYNAWSEAGTIWLKLALILTLVALVLVVLRALGVSMTLPVPAGQIYLATAGIALLLLLLTVLTGPAGDQGSEGGFEYSRGIAIFIAPLLGAAMAFGAWTHSQQEGSAPTGTGVGTNPTTPPAS